jgi:hypothetical protein
MPYPILIALPSRRQLGQKLTMPTLPRRSSKASRSNPILDYVSAKPPDQGLFSKKIQRKGAQIWRFKRVRIKRPKSKNRSDSDVLGTAGMMLLAAEPLKTFNTYVIGQRALVLRPDTLLSSIL